MMPKLGFLSILLSAFKKGACDDMIFVPVFIGYDQVLEESTYLHEVSGGEKKPESLSGLIKAVKFLKKRYGKIYIRFHEPISLNQLVQQQEKQLSEMTAKEQNTVCRRLGYRVLNAINRVTVVTPHALVASAILVSPKNKISYGQLTLHVQTFMRYLSSQEIMFADTLSDSIRALKNVLYIYAQRKLIDPVPEEDKWPTEDTLYIINEHKRPELEYYKNNAIAFFVPAAFVALAILVQDNFQFSAYDLHSNYNLISEFFHNEFVVDIEKTPEEIVQNNLQAFVTDNIITAHPTLSDTYNLPSDGLKKLKLFGNFLTTFFESYWIVLSFFKQAPRGSLPSRDRLKNMQSLAERMYKRMEIDRKEALSKITFENAEKYFTAHGIKGSEDVEKIKHFSNAILKYLDLLSW
jgi:glycerol-3-phosphate O-acyltransferase